MVLGTNLLCRINYSFRNSSVVSFEKDFCHLQTSGSRSLNNSLFLPIPCYATVLKGLFQPKGVFDSMKGETLLGLVGDHFSCGRIPEFIAENKRWYLEF